jgi:hypothetical protein
MKTAVDTNILLDILIPGQPAAASSKNLLDYYLSRGRLIICEVVFAELAAGFPISRELDQFLRDTGIDLIPSSPEALFLAGSRWAGYTGKSRKNACFAENAAAASRLHARNAGQCRPNGSTFWRILLSAPMLLSTPTSSFQEISGFIKRISMIFR